MVSKNTVVIKSKRGEQKSSLESQNRNINVFFCYRRNDGSWHAEWLDQHLNDLDYISPEGTSCHIVTYYDKTAPGVADWKKLHFPSLQTSQALILICTPGIAKDFSKLGKPDWVYEELRWWCRHRRTAPIVIDATGEGDRWLPKQVMRRWPDINRIELIRDHAETATRKQDSSFTSRICERIIKTIHESEHATVFEDLERFRKVNRRLVLALTTALLLLLGAIIASILALNFNRIAANERNIALARQLAAQAVNKVDSKLDLSLLLSLKACKLTESLEAKSSLITGVASRPHILAILRTEGSKIYEIAFNPQGTNLASVDQSGKIVLWNANTFKPMSSFSAGKQAVRTMAFSSDGEILFLSSWEKEVACLNAFTGKPLSKALVIDKVVSCVACSPRTTRFALGNADGTISLGRTKDMHITNTLLGHKTAIWSLCFSDDGASLASSAWDENIVIWDISSPVTRQLQFTDQVRGYCLEFSPDGKTLASGGSEKVIVLWDVESRQKMSELFGHDFEVSSLTFSPSRKILCTGDQEGNLILWDLESLRQVRRIKGHVDGVSSLAISNDGAKLASASSDGSVILWDLTSFEIFDSPLWSLDFNPKGDIIAIGMENGSIILWSIDERRITGSLAGPIAPVTSVSYNYNGTLLAVGSGNGLVTLWDVEQQSVTQCLQGHTAAISAVAFSPKNSSILVTGGWDSNVIIWDINKGCIISRLTGHKSKVSSVAFSPDGNTLASGGWDRLVILWDLESRKEKAVLNGHNSGVSCLDFSQDGKTLASGAWDRTVILWDVSKTNPPKALLLHEDAITALSFSLDGTLLASASRDKSIVLWDIASQRQLGSPLWGHEGLITEIAFSPRDEIFVSCALDQTFTIWPATFESWQKSAERISNRSLTKEEQRQFIAGSNWLNNRNRK